MVNYEELPSHIIEKILNYVEKPHKNFALVCKSFNEAVCRTDQFHLSINLEMMTLDKSIFKSMLHSKRKLSSVFIFSLEENSKLNLFELLKFFKALGKHIKKLRLHFFVKISLSDWIQIFSYVPNCNELELNFSFNGSEIMTTIPAITHNIQILKFDNPHYTKTPEFLQMLTSTNTLANVNLSSSAVDFKCLRYFFNLQPNIKHVKLFFKEILNSHVIVFDKSTLETLTISYYNEFFNENVYNFLKNQENLLDLQFNLQIDEFNSNAVVPFSDMKKLKTLNLRHNFKLQNLSEIGGLENLEKLVVNDYIFKDSVENLLQFNCPSVTHLCLISFISHQYKQEEYPFEMLSVIMPNLKNFELHTVICGFLDSITLSKRTFAIACLQKVMILWPNLESFRMIDMKSESFHPINSDMIYTVDINCLLDNNRKNKNLKILKLKFPMKLCIAHILKFIHDYPNLEHFEIDISKHELHSVDLALKYFKLMLKGWKHLKIIDIFLSGLIFEPSNFDFIIRYGTHLKKIKFSCRELINQDDFNEIFKPHFHHIEYNNSYFILENQ